MSQPDSGAASSRSDGDSPTPQPADDLAQGTAIGPYVILDRLGRGGMGTVYRARHSHLGRIVALKVLAPALLHNPTAILRFQREMLVVGQVAHPHVVRATDAGSANGRHFLALEYLPGVTLARLLKLLGPLPVADACELIRQAALGLQGIHEYGLVHRDIKPSNLFVDAEGCVRVLDLGLALLSDPQPGEDELTDVGQILGTADYLAPEQGSQSHSVDIRADLYALGCTLYKLLTNEVLFPDPLLDSLSKKIRAHTERPPPRIRAARPDVPVQLEAIINRLLAKNPDVRFAIPAEVALVLEPFAENARISRLVQTALAPAVPRDRPVDDGSPSKVTTPHTPLHCPEPPTPTHPHRRRPGRWLALAGICALLACLLLAIAWQFRPRNDEEPAKELTDKKPPAARAGEWQPLLVEEPVALRWPVKGNPQRIFRAEAQELVVPVCNGLALLRLGESSHARYRVAVTLHQSPWAGNIGLFFGYQPCELNGEPARRYQVVELVRVPTPGSGQLFRLRWITIHQIGPAGRQRQVDGGVATSQPFRLAPNEHKLELVVGPAGLDGVIWADKSVPELRTRVVSSPPEPAAARGAFGVYLCNGNGFCREGKFQFNEEQ